MNRVSNKIHSLLRYLPLVCAGMLIYGCDRLGEDIDPEEPGVDIKSTAVYVSSSGTGYIDLNAMVASPSPVRLDITSQPRKGQLSQVSAGLLKYEPNTDFKKGKDSFAFAIYSQSNRLLLTDSVILFVGSDPNTMPCGFYPQHDFVYDITAPVTIDVLANDEVICADNADFAVEIYKPGASLPPYHGTAVVVNNRIQYTPGGTFSGNDSIFYRIVSLRDTARSGIAVVHIKSCQFSLSGETFTFRADTLVSDTLNLDIFKNDALCSIPLNNYQFELLDDGKMGTAFYRNRGYLEYKQPESITTSFSDTVKYKLCHIQRCATASMVIKVIK